MYEFQKFYEGMEKMYRAEYTSIDQLRKRIAKEEKKKYKTFSSRDFQKMTIEILKKIKSEMENS